MMTSVRSLENRSKSRAADTGSRARAALEKTAVPLSSREAEKSPSLYFRALLMMLPNTRPAAEESRVRITGSSGREMRGTIPRWPMAA